MTDKDIKDYITNWYDFKDKGTKEFAKTHGLSTSWVSSRYKMPPKRVQNILDTIENNHYDFVGFSNNKIMLKATTGLYKGLAFKTTINDLMSKWFEISYAILTVESKRKYILDTLRLVGYQVKDKDLSFTGVDSSFTPQVTAQVVKDNKKTKLSNIFIYKLLNKRGKE